MLGRLRRTSLSLGMERVAEFGERGRKEQRARIHLAEVSAHGAHLILRCARLIFQEHVMRGFLPHTDATRLARDAMCQAFCARALVWRACML